MIVEPTTTIRVGSQEGRDKERTVPQVRGQGIFDDDGGEGGVNIKYSARMASGPNKKQNAMRSCSESGQASGSIDECREFEDGVVGDVDIGFPCRRRRRLLDSMTLLRGGARGAGWAGGRRWGRRWSRRWGWGWGVFRGGGGGSSGLCVTITAIIASIVTTIVPSTAVVSIVEPPSDREDTSRGRSELGKETFGQVDASPIAGGAFVHDGGRLGYAITREGD